MTAWLVGWHWDEPVEGTHHQSVGSPRSNLSERFTGQFVACVYLLVSRSGFERTADVA